MRIWLRRLRGAGGLALLWAVAWAVPGLLAGVPQWALVGFVAGAGFSLVLGIAGRRHRLEDLSLKRVAGWGALGAVVGEVAALPVFLVLTGGALEILPFLGTVAVLGAGSAAGTLALARGSDERISPPRTELPPEAGRG